MFFFFKQKTAYEMRISDWSSDVCSSDLESLRQDQNRQQQMQQDLRRSEDGLRLPDTPDSARLRDLQQRRADEAQQRQLDNQRRQIDARNRQLQNDRRQLETQQRPDRLTKPCTPALHAAPRDRQSVGAGK